MSAPESSSRRVRLFKNERLERLTLISPQTFALVWGVLPALILWSAWGTVGPLAGMGLVAGGLILWALFEYAMHRYLFHLKLDHPAARWFVFLIHGNHHDNPGDALREMMPLSVSLPVAAAMWGLFYALFGAPGTWLFLGWISGYILYDAVHYSCHQRPMRGRLAAMLKRHHMRHHYVDDAGNYAISAIFLDRLFGSRIGSLKR